jgi:hypothetical protein
LGEGLILRFIAGRIWGFQSFFDRVISTNA